MEPQIDKLISEHSKEKRESYDFRERRFQQWNESYLMLRDKIITNRLTQRQAINLPIIRETLQTWISKIDEPPELKFKARGRTNKHKTGEILVDTLWSYYFDKLKLDILDNLDKKIVGLQGRSFKICGMKNGEFFVDIIDPYDIEISPRVNPLDLNSAQYVIRTNIFKPLREILANKKYNEKAKQQLKTYLDSKEGLIKCAETQEAYEEKIQRLQTLGATNYDEYNVSEVLVEINESYKMVWDKENNQFVRHLIIIGADNVVLYNKPIKEALGISRLPIISWADDPDLIDIWCDGKADSVRTINKVVNMYISQDLENRSYRTFGMHFFNTLNGTFSPRAFDPKPFGMYGVPGNPKEIMQSMDIQPLGDTANQITFLKDLIQNSVAQTATERGVAAGSRTTLGEVEINLQQSTGRNMVTAKNYRRAWEEIGELFYEIMSNNSNGKITLYKEGSNGDMYSREIETSDWVMPEGYMCEVKMKSEQDALDQFAIQKAQYTIANFQDNPVATMIAKKKQLELMGWDSDEIERAMAFYEQGQQQSALPAPQEAQEMEGQSTGRMFNNKQMLQQETA
jgi:hypothetical protein